MIYSWPVYLHISVICTFFFCWIHCLLHRYVFDNQWHSLRISDEALDILKIRLRNSNLAAVLCHRQPSAYSLSPPWYCFYSFGNLCLISHRRELNPRLKRLTYVNSHCMITELVFTSPSGQGVRPEISWALPGQVRILSMSRFVHVGY